MSFIVCENLIKIYRVADLEVVALQGVDLSIEQGEMLAIVGPSGSGKSTLMNILGGLDSPSAGRVTVGRYNLGQMSSKEQALYRRREVGFVWQQSARNLLPYLTALQNVEMPMVLNGWRKAARRARAHDLLAQVGLEHRLHHRPRHMSLGEQQRTAIAVAMANEPLLLLADEPTGQVDSEAANTIFDTLHAVNQQSGVNVIIVTHDYRIARRVPRAITIHDGYMTTELRRTRTNGSEDAGEYIILDHGGRLQIPQGLIDELALKDRVQLDRRGDYIVIRRA
jgi:ABC-type lipoprotein export system ATPase subunit